MRYTQLQFSAYSSKRRTLFQQARFLLHELVNDRVHKHPCLCGACIYTAYRRSKKPEGRSFSKRMFFMFFMRIDFLMISLADKRLRRYDSMKKIGHRRWQDASSKYETIREFMIKEPDFLIRKDPKLWLDDRIEAVARRRTLAMFKKLDREEKSQDVKAFLRGILRKKSFYTYYRRAGDEALYRLVNKIEHDLLYLT